jgi:hypothetical protein
MTETSLCTRCGKEPPVTARAADKIRAMAGPSIPVGVCMPCALADPSLREELIRFAKRRREEFVKGVRDAVARPLEIIDDFVARLRD